MAAALGSFRVFWLFSRLEKRFVSPPFSDPTGSKGIWAWFTRAPRHRVRTMAVTIPGWPQFQRPLRALFLADVHAGSHAGDVARLTALVDEAATLRPDILCLGGDYMNMMFFGGGRVPPDVIASALARLDAPLGRFAVLGNHDEDYGARHVEAALVRVGISVMSDEVHRFSHEGYVVHLAGLAYRTRRFASVVQRLPTGEPAIVLAHDPAEFAKLPAGPYLMLSGHTHGGQVWVPGLGPVVNMSAAPLHWTYGHVVETGKQLYVTSGLGTSGVPVRLGIPPEIVLIEISGSPPRTQPRQPMRARVRASSIRP